MKRLINAMMYRMIKKTMEVKFKKSDAINIGSGNINNVNWIMLNLLRWSYLEKILKTVLLNEKPKMNPGIEIKNRPARIPATPSK